MIIINMFFVCFFPGNCFAFDCDSMIVLLRCLWRQLLLMYVFLLLFFLQMKGKKGTKTPLVTEMEKNKPWEEQGLGTKSPLARQN